MLKSQSDLDQVICNILHINYSDYNNLISKRKMGAIKAAVRLGADLNRAQIFAPLKLAITAEDIFRAYSTSVRSCMTDFENIGTFYFFNEIYCIWSESFRVLYNPKTNTILDSAYGFHRDIVLKELSNYFTCSSHDFLAVISEQRIDKVRMSSRVSKYLHVRGKQCPHNIHITQNDRPVHLLNIPKEASLKIFEQLEAYRDHDEVDLSFDIVEFNITVSINRYSYDSIAMRYPTSFKNKVERRIYQKLIEIGSNPFMDFTWGTYDSYLDKNHLSTFEDEIEYSVLSKFGEDYRDPMSKSRTNYDSKYMRKKNDI